jgi:hypothetical protein
MLQEGGRGPAAAVRKHQPQHRLARRQQHLADVSEGGHVDDKDVLLGVGMSVLTRGLEDQGALAAAALVAREGVGGGGCHGGCRLGGEVASWEMERGGER